MFGPAYDLTKTLDNCQLQHASWGWRKVCLLGNPLNSAPLPRAKTLPSGLCLGSLTVSFSPTKDPPTHSRASLCQASTKGRPQRFRTNSPPSSSHTCPGRRGQSVCKGEKARGIVACWNIRLARDFKRPLPTRSLPADRRG